VSTADAVALEGVGKRLGSSAVLDGLDLRVRAGAITAVLGASGSGKTTLLRVIAGLERVDAGRVSVAGRVVDDGRNVVDARHRGVGYVPQDAALFPHLTARANIAFGVRRAGAAVAEELLHLIGLAGLGDRHPHQLSGGQQQRVALARALAIRPPLVLLDEPFAALDAPLRVELRRDVANVLARTATAAVLVTHDQDEALALADEVALLHGGRIIAEGEPAELYRRPPSATAAATLGAANLLDADVTGSSAHCVLGELALDEPPGFDGPARLLLRPEQLRITTDGAGTEARIVRVEHRGYDALVELEVSGAEPLIARLAADGGPRAGSAVRVTVVGPGRAWPDDRGDGNALH
jgi:iron(III) transport system ATP-binding protein